MYLQKTMWINIKFIEKRIFSPLITELCMYTGISSIQLICLGKTLASAGNL